MHEVTLVRGVVAAALQQMEAYGGSSVEQISLTIEASDHMNDESVRHLFAMLATDTPAEHAVLNVRWIPAPYQCVMCRHQFQCECPAPFVACPVCGEGAVPLSHAMDCTIDSIQFCDDMQHTLLQQKGGTIGHV